MKKRLVRTMLRCLEKAFLVNVFVFWACSIGYSATCVEISDIPLEVRRLSAPANIMVLLDDSGSMDWEMLIPGFYNGAYQDTWSTYGYVFDDPCSFPVYGLGCHQTDGSWPALPRGSGRLVWKTQWFDYNKTYYNPAMTYEPWVTMTGQFDNANPDTPRSHPLMAAPTFSLSASYDTTSITSGEVIADNANPAVFTKTGSWETASDAQAYNLGYYHTSQDHSDVTATWSPYLLGGQYQVFTRYRATDKRDKNVPYTITHTGGTTTVKVNQQEHGGEWFSLGTYSFATGPATVKITFHVDDNDKNRVCADAVKFVPRSAIPVDIKNAHYYVWSAQTGKPYLVIIDGGVVRYYQVNDINANGMVDPGDLVQTASPPADVVTARTYAQERQNFANWFTFYRRRIFAAQNAVGKLIKGMQGVRIGIYSINKNLIQPTLPVKVGDQDQGATLLSLLYAVNALGGTPLQTGLEAVGRYFDKGDNIKLDGYPGDDSPWESDANGGSCQQAFTIMITDGYYNGGLPSISEPNADGSQGFPYADSYSRTLADIAMYYYKRDLNTTLPDNSPTNPYDSATHQHMVTYSIGFGVFGTLNQNDYDATFKHKVSGASIVWPNPQNSDATKIDDFWHAAVNGRGSYLTATNPEELTESLQAVMQNVDLRLKSSAPIAVSGDKLYQKLTPDLLMFQNTYSSDGWVGDIKAYTVNPITGAVNTNTTEWSAAAKLQSRTWDNRLIATYTGSAGIPFQYDKLTDSQKSQLDANPTTAQNLLKYLRGDTYNEPKSGHGGTFRDRFARLGDIVHSAPVFSNGILYAGSNDGLLHAFKADSGEELFAYAPNLVFEHLKNLAGTSYAHRYFVDLTPTVTDLKFDGDIKTYLVGGLGKGGRGYFALDVTDITQTKVPKNEDELAAMVLWEYPRTGTSDGEVADLGYSFSRPNIVRSNAVAAAAAKGIVIFGNGYDSSNGHAVLYVLRADTGELLKKIDTGVATCNGLSSAITVDVNYDNKVDYVYAGDLNGNLWKFDLTSTDYNQWDVAYRSSDTPKPLFKTPSGQPITTKPNVMYHCTKHGYLVTFGTGRYLNEDDLSDTSQQAVYGIWDYGDDVDDSEYVGTLASGKLTSTSTNLPITVSLLQQTVDRVVTVNGMDMRIITANAADWKTTTTADGACGDNAGTQDCDPNGSGAKPDPLRNVGWYLNLPSDRERVVSDVIVRSGILTVVSHAPSNSLCGGSGESWLMTLDACSGSRLSKTQFDINGDGKIDTQDLVNIGTPQNPNMVVPSGIKYDGKVQPPTYLILPDGTEFLYMSSSKTKIETQRERAAKLGITYWRVMH